MTDPNTADLDQVRDQIDALKIVEAQIKALTETKTSLQNDIKAVLGDNEVGTLDGDTVFTWTRSKRNALDQKALKAEQPEIVARYMTATEVRSFRWAE
ncbi:hypothetical protein [Gordonia amicalis]|uniref:Uncharacterized protein n=1 Tax=Gordonia amicalis TaxID=89053 RepID=A0ABU4DJM2_9ACTN|nr:hypothetical protein [Gordonia amicalis]MDV6309937.1 hypothetical protein [Gordonia amicalis]